jgi:hypothetical protein
VYVFPGWYLSRYGNLHAKQEWELYHPMMVGEHVIARSLISDRYSRRDRDYVINEVTFSDAGGRVLSRGRTASRSARPLAQRGWSSTGPGKSSAAGSDPLEGSGGLTPLVKPITRRCATVLPGTFPNNREAKKLASRTSWCRG